MGITADLHFEIAWTGRLHAKLKSKQHGSSLGPSSPVINVEYATYPE